MWTTGEIRRLRIARTRRCVIVTSIAISVGMVMATIAAISTWLTIDTIWMTALCQAVFVLAIIASFSVNRSIKKMRSWLAENENLITCMDSIPSLDPGTYLGFFCVEILPHPDPEFLGTVWVDAIDVDTITIEGGADLAVHGNYMENLDVVDEELVSLDEYLEDHDVDEQGG